MITDKDRSGYIGGSDTGYVMKGWNSKTFDHWWRIKLGEETDTYTNEAMEAGTAYEHRILDALNIPELEKDKQIISGRLRVNLDGNTKTKVYEVKTYKAGKPFRVSKDYWRQVQVEMYALGVRHGEIVAYALTPEDYKNHNREIDPKRISHHKIKYDRRFIQEYLKRLEYLSECLENGRWPIESEV